ncbi:MAG TPA: molybdenum cofactor guanylyltransferase [Actinomycetota bacterium]
MSRTDRPGAGEVTGLLLAGGAGARMGADKAGLEFEGERLARRVADRLAEVCGTVLVASGDGRRLAWLGLEQVADPIPRAGPLAGLVAGLERAATSLVAVAAVDMPFASPAVLRLLLDRWSPGMDAVVPATDRGLEPLHAIYVRSAGPALRAALESGERAVHRALDRLAGVTVVGPDGWRAADPEGRFAFNVNRPEDLAGPAPPDRRATDEAPA